MANSEKNADWRDFYRQAVFECDSEKFEMRIEAANQAIRCRVCEMWQLGPIDVRERSQLDAASYFLGLLRTIAGKKKPSSTAAHPIPAPDQHSA